MEESRISSKQQKLATLSHILTFQNDHQHSKMIGDRSKRQIQTWLTAEAQLLIDKHDREEIKQERLKRLEAEFEEHRAKKQKQIEQKLVVTSQNKNKNLQTLQKKLSQVASRHQSVHAKALSEKQEELQRQFDTRKAYVQESTRTASRLSHKTNRSTASGHHLPVAENQQEIERKMKEINHRLLRAQAVSRQRQAQALQKVKEHNTTALQTAQEKAARSLQQQINEFSTKIAEKLEGAENKKQRHDRTVERRQEEKHKAFSEKLRHYHDNIRHLQDEESYKLQELNRKFDKNFQSLKSWKDEKGEIYHRKFLANYSLIEEKKVTRADQIMQKHLEISNKNRVYRERKGHLFQAIKCDPTA